VAAPRARRVRGRGGIARLDDSGTGPRRGGRRRPRARDG
jgi:hypothetical protein